MGFFGVLLLFALPASLLIASLGFGAAAFYLSGQGQAVWAYVAGALSAGCLALLTGLAILAIRAAKKRPSRQDGSRGEIPPPVEQVIRCMLSMQRFPWEQGVCAQALYEIGRRDLYVPMAFDAIKRAAPDGRLAMAGGGRAVSDPASNGEVCLRAWEKTHDERFRLGAEGMLRYLLNDAPRTGDGVICHNEPSRNPDGSESRQLWIDGLYMAPPFLAVMGHMDEALRQVEGYYRHLYDAETGLFYHIKDTESGLFPRKKHWATGNGWALMGLCRLTEAAKAQGDEAARAYLDGKCASLAAATSKYQLEDGRFMDILDEESFADGTSALMFAASVYRGVAGGYIGRELLPMAEKAYSGMLSRIDGMGLVHGVCGCPDFQREGTSAEAQAAMVMACASAQGRQERSVRNGESTDLTVNREGD